MLYKSLGIITYIKIIRDNDILIKILSVNDKIISGIVYGGNSSKKKLIYQIGYFIDFNLILKNYNSLGSINAEISKPFIFSFFNDKFKAFSLLAIISLINISIIEGQKIGGLFESVKNLLININKNKHWIIEVCEWLFNLLKMIGYQIDHNKKLHFKYFNLNTHNFSNQNIDQNSIEFPHELFNENKKITYLGIRNMFIIFENIYIKNHLSNLNYFNNNMPSNFINFKNLILKKLQNK